MENKLATNASWTAANLCQVDKDGNFKSAYFLKDGKKVDLKIYNQKETNFAPKQIPPKN